jgi:hypothetical protein
VDVTAGRFSLDLAFPLGLAAFRETMQIAQLIVPIA